MSVTARNWQGIERHGVGDCFCWGDLESCVCPPLEKALRVIAAGIGGPLTEAEREQCFREIDRVKGHSRADHADATDAELANGVLSAWTDFCRDKGLL